MKLVASQLKEGENPFSFSSESDPWVKDLVSNIAAQGNVIRAPLQMALNLTKLEPDYYLKGRLNFEVEQCCARCAENFGLKISHPIELALVHNASGTAGEKTILSQDTDELDITYFDGPEIDLAPLMREQFFLSLPYQSVCQEGCLGVCQHCGKNLNLGKCSCDAQPPSGPFDALKTLKV